MNGSGPQEPPAGLRAIPRSVWILGFVSLFMDVSSEMIHGLLPVFLTTVLGASVVSVGWIEGAAEAIASVTKVGSGALSDWIGRRKALAAVGYGLAALTKPLFPLASSVSWVLAARCLDRVGKGIRGAPRDALLAELSPDGIRGASFGLRQSLDTVGAFAGPLLATLLMVVTGNSLRLVFWIAVLPAAISLALILFGVSEPGGSRARAEVRQPIRRADLRGLTPSYWGVVGAAGALSLARFSEAFLILRASSSGVPLGLLPLVLVLMNLAYAVSAYPVGRLSDRLGRRGLLAAGFLVLAASQGALALDDGLIVAGIGVVLWGLHLGMTQGVFAALVADVTPEAVRGTAFGIFHLTTGLATLVASAAAGSLWQAFGPRAPFATAGAFTLLAALALAGVWRRPRRHIRV